ncbi:hypothetical protein [Treponema pallidum]|nr:hypothetical protein [Treponema pallidum]QUK94920.2 hypothetical protein KEA10_00195 [Treponema pallidum]
MRVHETLLTERLKMARTAASVRQENKPCQQFYFVLDEKALQSPLRENPSKNVRTIPDAGDENSSFGHARVIA